MKEKLVTMTFLSPRISILLLGLAFWAGACGPDPAPPATLIRLADPDRIESISSTLLEQRHEASKDPEEKGLLGKWDGSDPWHHYKLGQDSPGQGSGEPSSPMADAPLTRDGKSLVIGQHMGVARIVPVKGDARILVECGGTFDGKRMKATVVKLCAYTRFPEGNPAGLVQEIVASLSKGRLVLNAGEEGDHALSLINTSHDTQAFLLLVYSNKQGGGRLDWVKMTYQDSAGEDPSHEPTGEGPTHEIEGGGLSPDLLLAWLPISRILKPSLMVSPETRITFKETRLPPRPEFRCSLGQLLHGVAGVTVTMTARDRKGEAHLLFTWQSDPDALDWEVVTVNADHLAGEAVKLSLVCTWDDPATAKSTVLPVIAVGSPRILSQDTSLERPGFNLVLISLDTLRSDHLGCYGYERPVSPNIDRLARNGTLFKRAYSHSPYTLPSHASLFTSQYPSVIRAEHPGAGPIPRGSGLLAEILAEEGWATAAFLSAGYLSHTFGFHWGYDLYCEVDPIGDRYLEGNLPKGFYLGDGSHGSLDRALAWMEEMKNQRFCLFLHTMMIHDFLPPGDRVNAFYKEGALEPGRTTLEALRKKFGRKKTLSDPEVDFFIDMYDATIQAGDEMVGEVAARIKALGLEKDTIVVITSDHGEEFLDHGNFFHKKTLYEEMIHIPFIMVVPGMEPGREVDRYVSHVDFVPTVLELMGLDQGARSLSGRSLVPLLRGEAGDNSLVYAEVNVPDWSSRRCVIMDGWKYIEGSTDDSLSHPAPSAVEVFNLNQDPREKQRSSDPELDRNLKNLMGETKNRLNQLRKTLNFGRSDPSTLSPEMVEVLRQQGYL